MDLNGYDSRPLGQKQIDPQNLIRNIVTLIQQDNYHSKLHKMCCMTRQSGGDISITYTLEQKPCGRLNCLYLLLLRFISTMVKKNK